MAFGLILAINSLTTGRATSASNKACLISFKPEALVKFAKSKQSNLEKIEDVELLRAIEIGLKIKTVNLKGDSFSVDVEEDYRRAKSRMNKDKFFKLYK